MQKLKQNLGTSNREIVLLYILMGAGIAIGIISGIGATCTTFDVLTMGGSSWWDLPAFSVIESTQIFFILSYIVTWAVGIGWGVLFWGLKQGKSWFYPLAIITSIAGFISGFIPSWILWYEDYQSFGASGMAFTPSWFRAIGNVILLIYLLLPMVRRGINTLIAEKSASPGASVGSQVSQAAFVLFGFGIVIISYTLFMLPMTHIYWNTSDVYLWLGINFEQFLLIGGLVCIILGLVTLFAGRLIDKVYSKPVHIQS